MIQEFHLLEENQLNFHPSQCDLCGENRSVLLYSIPFLNYQFKFVECRGCGLVYQNPLLDSPSRKHIYESLEYWEHAASQSKNSPMLNYYHYISNLNTQQTNSKIRLKWVQSKLPIGSRILDIGCSNGLFVHTLNEVGYLAVGMDISFPVLKWGRQNYRTNVIQADFEEEWPFSKPFDGITCFATLSNISRPSHVFSNVSKFLRPGGYFIFNFGDCKRLISRFLGKRLYLLRPTAATLFTRKTVSEYCFQNRLKVLGWSSDIQEITLGRLFGSFRIPWIDKLWCNLGAERAKFHFNLLTGYTVYSIRE